MKKEYFEEKHTLLNLIEAFSKKEQFRAPRQAL